MAFTSETTPRRAAEALAGARRRAWLPAVRLERGELAIAAILASTLVIALSDVFSKILTQRLPPIEVAWLRFCVFTLLVCPMVLRAGSVRLLNRRPWALLIRGVASGAATALAIIGFGYLPLAEATAIGFVAPLVVTALAVLVLREPVGVWRWAAAFIGLAGVLIIVQPGTRSFQLASLLPLGAAVASACAVIATRCLRDVRTSTTLVSTAIAGTLVITPPALMGWVTPTAAELGLALASGALATASNVLQVYAYRCAPASMLAPFSYAQMLWATIFGLTIFGYFPGPHVLVGAAIIAASGTHTAVRERTRRSSPPAHRRDTESSFGRLQSRRVVDQAG